MVPVPRGSSSVAVLSYPQPGVTVCAVRGDVDMVTQPAISRRLVEAACDDNPHLVIDLSAVTFFGSTGLHALVEILDSHCGTGHLALVLDPRTRAATQMRHTSLDRLFEVHDALDSALRACRRPLPA